jgi:FKBP-type peptidyl-prolyl cis-trans isomerase FkpA
VGPSLAQLKDDIDVASLFDAISTGLSKGQPKMTEADATATIQAFMGSKQAEMQAKAAALLRRPTARKAMPSWPRTRPSRAW